MDHGSDPPAARSSTAAGSSPGPDDSRRGFLKLAIGVIGTGVGAITLAPGALYVLHPLDHETTAGTGDFLAAGALPGFPDGVPVKVDLFSDRVDAWNRIESAKVGSAWVVNHGGTLHAWSTVCPHLGCAIEWDPDSGKFKCPCHRSAFAADGTVESGPAPRGLDELEVETRGGLVSIRYLRFRQGISEKEQT